MTLSYLKRHAVLSLACVMASILGGCSTMQTSPVFEPATLRLQRFQPALLKSDASGRDLLYITSSSSSTLYVYTYPGAKLRHTVTGYPLYLLYNECADTNGNVYVLDYFGSSEAAILIYAHGAISPTRTISAIGGIVDDCSSDPITGNLAVSSYYPPGQLVFPNATGSPYFYAYPNGFSPNGCSYDDNGNLFVAGSYASSSNVALVELAKGSASFVNIRIPSIPQYELHGGVKWAGKHLVLGNGTSTLYRFVVRGTRAKKVGVTYLDGASSVGDFWIHGGTVVGANNSYSGPGVLIWKFPLGGQPIRTISNVGAYDGVAVSVPPPPHPVRDFRSEGWLLESL